MNFFPLNLDEILDLGIREAGLGYGGIRNHVDVPGAIPCSSDTRRSSAVGRAKITPSAGCGVSGTARSADAPLILKEPAHRSSRKPDRQCQSPLVTPTPIMKMAATTSAAMSHHR